MTRHPDGWPVLPGDPPPDPPPTRGAANWILAGLITAFGVVVFAYTVRSGRADSAVLFVALPVLLAAALALRPGRTGHDRAFTITTIALLLASVALHEGAVCVILAAPLVYGVVHGTLALIRYIQANSRKHRMYALLVLPLLFGVATEGTSDRFRVDPAQSVTVSRVVELPAAEVATRLATGPHPVEVRSLPLRLLGVPLP